MSVISPKICHCYSIQPLFRNYGPVSAPSSCKLYQIQRHKRYSVIVLDKVHNVQCTKQAHSLAQLELQIYSPSPKLTTNCREQRLTALPPASGNPTGQSQPSASPARLTAHLTLTMPPKVGRCDTKYFHSFEIMMKPIVSYTNTNIHGVPGVRWRYRVLVGSSSSGDPSWVSHRYNRHSWTTKVKKYFF